MMICLRRHLIFNRTSCKFLVEQPLWSDKNDAIDLALAPLLLNCDIDNIAYRYIGILCSCCTIPVTLLVALSAQLISEFHGAWPIIGVLLITEQRPVLQHQLWDANSTCFCSPMCMSLKGKRVSVMSKTLL